jgi:hypothetical protein
MTPTDRLRLDVGKRLWRAGLSVYRLPDHRQQLGVEEFPDWRLGCHSERHWHLWTLYDDAQAESPDPGGYFCLITVDRRDGSEVATFALELLAAWLSGEKPFVIPRRKRRAGFAHHTLLQSLSHPQVIPLLASRQEPHRILLSAPLAAFKSWLACFPAPRATEASSGQQLTFSLWQPPEVDRT